MLRTDVVIDGSVAEIMAREGLMWETAVTRAVDGVGVAIKNDWRGQIVGAGLGDGLAFSVRSKTYPDWTVSANAAAEVKSAAGDILTGHDEGSLITARNGRYLAIPMPVVRDIPQVTPEKFKRVRGMDLRPVKTARGLLLVAEGRLTKRARAPGFARAKKKLRLKSGAFGMHAVSFVAFVLVPQVKLPKRLDLMPAAQAHAARLDGMIVRAYERIDR